MTDAQQQPTHPRSHGPWTILRRHVRYQDPWVRVDQDDVVRPDGQAGTYCVVHLKPGVCVVAVDDRQQVHLTQEFHYGVGRVTLEGVSGGIDPGETAEATAKRELREELGIEAESWVSLGCVDPFTANVVSPTELYLALGLTLGVSRPEGTEVIQRVTLTLDDAVRQVLNGQISHAPSCQALLRAARHLGVLRFPVPT